MQTLFKTCLLLTCVGAIALVIVHMADADFLYDLLFGERTVGGVFLGIIIILSAMFTLVYGFILSKKK